MVKTGFTSHGKVTAQRILAAALVLFTLLGVGILSTPAAAEDPVVIMIDPGHGGTVDPDPGAQATHGGETYSERDLVLKIAFYLKEELETYEDVQVFMTRTTNTEDPTIKARVDAASERDADLLVSLHLDSPGPHSEATDGAHALISNGNYNADISDTGRKVGAAILLRLGELGVRVNGLLQRNASSTKNPDGSTADYYGIVRYGIWEKIPSIIIEHCYITSESDFQSFLSSDEKLKALALADAAGIADHFRLQKKPEPIPWEPSMGLTDCAGHWAEASISRAVEAGWVQGYPDHTFRPNYYLNRADFVTLLARLSGEDLTAFSGSSFSDVSADSYYARSVAWAVDAGIVNGFPDGTFYPTASITREQMAHIMTLYLKHKGFETVHGSDAGAGIPDVDSVSWWALEDVLFCYEAGLLNGRESGFVPDGGATRAEACTVLARLNDYSGRLPEATETPVNTVEPEETAEPEETTGPEETAEPVETVEPAETEEPEETAGSEETEKPAETAEPSENAAPTEMPAIAETQEAEADDPMETPEPMGIDKAEVTEIPVT